MKNAQVTEKNPKNVQIRKKSRHIEKCNLFDIYDMQHRHRQRHGQFHVVK